MKIDKRNKWTEEEIEILKNNYIKGPSYVVNLIPNHPISSIKKKAKILNLIIDKKLYDVDLIKKIAKESFSFADVFRKLNKSGSGRSYKIIRSFIINNNINISHFDPWKNNDFNSRSKRPILSLLGLNTNVGSSRLKEKLYDEGIKERICEKCGQNENWKGDKISLILDHINGINTDNRLENLRILCPNCNATLITHCRGYKGIEREIQKNKIEEENLNKRFGFTEEQLKVHLVQRRVQRPLYNDLIVDINNFGYVKTGKKYGVSDNAIRAWKKMYEKYGENF